MIFGTFLQSPPTLDLYFLGDKKSPVFVFCCFRDLLDLNLIKDIYSVNILSLEASREVEENERSHEPQKSLGGATTDQVAPPGLVWP
jgi:hypothetical protein